MPHGTLHLIVFTPSCVHSRSGLEPHQYLQRELQQTTTVQSPLTGFAMRSLYSVDIAWLHTQLHLSNTMNALTLFKKSSLLFYFIHSKMTWAKWHKVQLPCHGITLLYTFAFLFLIRASTQSLKQSQCQSRVLYNVKCCERVSSNQC